MVSTGSRTRYAQHHAISKIGERFYHVSYWDDTSVFVPFIVVINLIATELGLTINVSPY